MDTDRYLMQLLTDYLWAVQSYMNSTNWFFFSADQNIFKLLCKLKFNYSSQEIDMDKNLQGIFECLRLKLAKDFKFWTI